MKASWQTELNIAEEWIRQGRLKPASSQLKEIASELFAQSARAVPESTRLRFAQLTRRAGLPLLGLRALKSLVRPGVRRAANSHPASPAVTTEYAALLLRLGAVAEARGWLKQVRASDTPEKFLFEAFAFFRRWDYASAVAPLEAYGADPRVGDYAKLVGQINLAVALVDTRADARAEELLARLIEHTRQGGHRLLLGNALETLVQLRVFQGRLDEALLLLQQIKHEGFLAPGAEGLLFRKWEAIARRAAAPRDQSARTKLLDLQKEAESLRAWEVVRDCDYHEARISRDPALMAKLYFGTPYPAYRARIVELGYRPDPSATFDWRLGAGAELKHAILDLTTGVRGGRKISELRPGSLGLRLLQTLASDFYRPWRIAELHGEIYPEMYFDSHSSSLRIHQLLHRVRGLLERARSSVRIEEQKESYQLVGARATVIRVGKPSISGITGRLAAFCAELERALGSGVFFTAPEAQAKSGMSGRTVRRFLKELVQLGMIKKTGTRRSAEYVIKTEIPIN